MTLEAEFAVRCALDQAKSTARFRRQRASDLEPTADQTAKHIIVTHCAVARALEEVVANLERALSL